MARKKTKYDTTCYYDNKLVGRCTVADGDAYALMMEQCNGNAAQVLQEYAYFSPELKTILEKVAAIQAKQNRATPGNLFAEPCESPWGKVQYCDTLYPGVFSVSTAGHGGIMVSKEMTAILSPAARKCGEQFVSGYLCFEEDCQASVVMRELLDKKLCDVPDYVTDKARYEESINNSLQKYNPQYWRARQSGIEKSPAKQPAVPQHDDR